MERIGGTLAGLRALWQAASNQAGQTLAEYSMIITIIAVGTTLLAVIVFRDSLVGAFDAVRNCLDGSC
jgi:hypothetical protein